MTEESFLGLSTSGALMSKTELDHNFLRKEGESAFLFYPDRKMTVGLKASEDFCHYVVHSPRDGNFVCVEPQTCSIDAHNLLEKGFEYSNLLFAPPKQTVSGSAVITVKCM